MSKRLQQMLDKSAEIKGVNEILPSEVKPSETPKTGVGLMAQLAAAKVRIQELENAVIGKAYSEITLSSISPNPWQPRRVFDEAEIRKLADSIAEVGLIQPITVRRVLNEDTYQLIAGERRLRAHSMMGLGNIKAVVIEANDDDMIAIALAENFDRTDLTAYEIALAIRSMANRTTKKDLAKALGITRSNLYYYLSFFDLPTFVIDDLEASPGIIGYRAAGDIAAVIKKHGDRAAASLRTLWPRIKAGEMDQGKIAGLIETSILRVEQPRSERDIRKLYVGKEQAGSITRDSSKLQITIKAASLTPEMEAEFRAFAERFFPPNK